MDFYTIAKVVMFVNILIALALTYWFVLMRKWHGKTKEFFGVKEKELNVNIRKYNDSVAGIDAQIQAKSNKKEKDLYTIAINQNTQTKELLSYAKYSIRNIPAMTPEEEQDKHQTMAFLTEYLETLDACLIRDKKRVEELTHE